MVDLAPRNRPPVSAAFSRWRTALLGAEPLSVIAPGLVLVALAAGLAFAVHQAADVVSALVVAVLLGALLANAGLIPARCQPGMSWAARKLLRLGVVLLGFRLTLSQIRDLGPKGLGLVVVVVTLTFFGTQWLGGRLGLSRPMSLLVATGFSICGASAVAAMRGVTPEADDEDVAYAIALVTLCGTLAIFVLPPLGHAIGFRHATLGSWIGASVHDVAQTVAAAGSTGDDAVKTAAIVVKLTRVVLLAPLVAGMSLWRRRRLSAPAAGTKRPPVIPMFVVGFLLAIVGRTLNVLPKRSLDDIKTVETLLFAAAMVGLGAGVRFDRLRRIGPRPLVLGLGSWAMIAAVSAVGVRILNI